MLLPKNAREMIAPAKVGAAPSAYPEIAPQCARPERLTKHPTLYPYFSLDDSSPNTDIHCSS
jgi:hypothetical protein